MIQIVQGFKLATRDAVDNRLLLSKEEMRSINDNQMPEKYFAICKDDGMLYLYNKSAVTLNEDTGKFTLFSASKIESISINGTVLPIENKNVDLPMATAEKLGMVKLGLGFEIGTNDELTFNFEAISDGSIPVKKIDWEESIIDGSNI